MNNIEKNKLSNEELETVSGGCFLQNEQLLDLIHRKGVKYQGKEVTVFTLGDFLKSYGIHCILDNEFGGDPNVYFYNGQRLSHYATKDLLESLL